MDDTKQGVEHPGALCRLGKRMRRERERMALAQAKVPGMRQATISRIENGGDVTLDTFLSYAARLGLEIALVPIGQAERCEAALPGAGKAPPARAAFDLLAEFDHLRDPA